MSGFCGNLSMGCIKDAYFPVSARFRCACLAEPLESDVAIYLVLQHISLYPIIPFEDLNYSRKRACIAP